jgi:two-component system LytT family response regulator
LSKTKVLIVDDEKLSQDKIARFLKGGNFEIERASNGVEGLEKLKSFSPEVVFLDVEMPELSGFDFLQQVESRPFKVIFQTAFDEFALKAFEENACDYLLKPFTKERFEQALNRALNGIAAEEKLRQLEGSLHRGNTYLEKITVKQNHKFKIIEADEIICLVSRDHCTCLHTAEFEYIIDLSIQHLSERLNPAKFFRIHRNSIVNREFISSVHSRQQMIVELRNGLRLPVSRSHRTLMRAAIQQPSVLS